MSDRDIINHAYDTYGDVFTLPRQIAVRLPVEEFKARARADFERHAPAIAAKLRVEFERSEVAANEALKNFFTNTDAASSEAALLSDLQEFNQKLKLLSGRLGEVRVP